MAFEAQLSHNLEKLSLKFGREQRTEQHESRPRIDFGRSRRDMAAIAADVDIERSLRSRRHRHDSQRSGDGAGRVPVIDMSRPDAAEAMWAAATTVGFFTVTNHGVPDELIENGVRLVQTILRAGPRRQAAREPLRAAAQQRLRVLFSNKTVDGHGRPEGKSADHGARGRHGRPLAQ